MARRHRQPNANRRAIGASTAPAGLGAVSVSMLTEIFLCFLYTAENVIRLFAGNKPDIPRAPSRKPTQPQEVRPTHLLAFGIHARTCAAQRRASPTAAGEAGGARN